MESDANICVGIGRLYVLPPKNSLPIAVKFMLSVP